jgi:hypothetical protein
MNPNLYSPPVDYSLALPSAVRIGTPITVKIYSTGGEDLRGRLIKFRLYQGGYYSGTPIELAATGNQFSLSATFNGSSSILEAGRQYGKQYIVASDNFNTELVGGVVVTLP